jgi:hypothetical protein
MRLWVLELIHDFGKDCRFCEDARGCDRQANQPQRLLPTSLRRRLAPRKMDEERAAALIQRNYRGYRERRILSGLHLSASARWREAIKECEHPAMNLILTVTHLTPFQVEYRKETRPISRKAEPSNSADRARQNWRRIGAVTKRAAGDDTSSEDTDVAEEGMTPEALGEYRQHKHAAEIERKQTAKLMNLEYFLEMVDVKHRYGSNLRTYHQEWLRSDMSNENFFYWLDHGKGKSLDLPLVSRAKLDSERVRYLSREERQSYLVKVDSEGRLCWAKNGERISTTPLFKDTLDGIVPIDDVEHQAWKAGHRKKGVSASSSSSSSSMLSTGSNNDNAESQHYVNQELTQAKGWKKLKYVSATTILNQLLQKSVQPNSWIFVADTSFRLYIGIKQSGSFQHSSILGGARISAAGLIKIKDGQLRRLSPLSGHYRPPTRNFRLFVHSLKDEGVDMSRVSISRAYAVLVGLEAYTRTRKKIKSGLHHVHEGEEKILHPEVAKKKKEDALDHSMSAVRERQILTAEAAREQEEKGNLGLLGRLLRRVKFESKTDKGKGKENEKDHPPISAVKSSVKVVETPAPEKDRLPASTVDSLAESSESPTKESTVVS